MIGCGEGLMGVFDEKGQLPPVHVLDYQWVPMCCVLPYSLATLQDTATSLGRAWNLGFVQLHIQTLL